MERAIKDKTHMEQVERWAYYVRDHPNDWKKPHTEFINALFKKQEDFIKRLAKTKEGKEKIIKLYNIKNINSYKKLLG